VRGAPIRVRLTAWYVLVLALVLAAISAFVVTRLRSDLTSEIDRSSDSAANQIARGYLSEGAPEFRDVSHTVLPGPRDYGSGAQILDPSGQVVLAVGDPATATSLVDSASLEAALRGDHVTSSGEFGPADEHLRILALPVGGASPKVLVVAESLDDVDDSVHRVLILLLVASAVGLGLVSLGGWWIARKALEPVERMTTRADRIGIDDLSQRIAVPRAQDEVGHLGRTLNAMLDRLEEGVDVRQRLVADASHELRAPLTAMRSELEVSLRHDSLEPQAQGVLTSVRDEVVRMGRIVDNLLTLARVDEGGLELLRAPEDLRALAEQTVRSYSASAAAADVTLEVVGNGVSASVDRDRLSQVLGNLIDNALRFSLAGGEVRLSVCDEDGGAQVTVTGEGPGVPAEARERIFKRFSREDVARGRTGGAGLGLAICREIVDAHGGRIRVEDGEPRGSAFVVWLPLAEPGGPPPPRR